MIKRLELIGNGKLLMVLLQRHLNIKEFPMALYGIIAATVVIIIAIPNEGLLPVFLMSVMAIACAGQVVLDIRRHPHHRFFKM